MHPTPISQPSERIQVPVYEPGKKCLGDYVLSENMFPETKRFLSEMRKKGICVHGTNLADGSIEIRFADVTKASSTASFSFLSVPAFQVSRSELESGLRFDKPLLDTLRSKYLNQTMPSPPSSSLPVLPTPVAPPVPHLMKDRNLGEYLLDETRYPKTHDLLCRIRKHGLCVHGTNREDGRIAIRLADITRPSDGEQFRFVPGAELFTSYDRLADNGAHDSELCAMLQRTLSKSCPEISASVDRPREFHSQPGTSLTPVEAVVKFSENLSPETRWKGAEIHAGDTLVTLLLNFAQKNKLSFSKETLSQNRMGLLHTLQDIDRQHPQYLSQLASVSESHLSQFVLCLAEELQGERDRQSQRVVIDSRTRVHALCNCEDHFSAPDLLRFFSRFQTKDITVHKADSTNTHKEAFLNGVTECAAKDERPAVVWFNVHGQPEFLQLRTGFRTEETITTKELAASLLKGSGSEVNLSHLTVVLDSCFSWNFGQNLIRELMTGAEKQGKTIQGLPLIISAAQRGMVAWSSTEGQSHLTKALQMTLPQSPEELGVSDFLKADALSSKEALQLLKSGAVDRQMKSFLPGQDNALFSRELTSLDEILGKVQQRMAKKGIEIPIPTSTLRGKRRFPLEISRLPAASSAPPGALPRDVNT